MGSEVLQWLASDNGVVVHVSIFAMLLLSGIGLPIPEDVPLLLAGVAAEKGIVHVKAVFATCYFGVLIGDQLMYFLGYFFGERLLQAGRKSPLLPSLTQEKIDKLGAALDRRRLLYIFVARHLFPIRSMTFISAGSLRMPFLRFFLADAAAALISTTIMLSIGFWLGSRLTPEGINHIAHQANLYILLAVAVFILIWFLRRMYRKRKRPRLSPLAPEVESSAEHLAEKPETACKA